MIILITTGLLLYRTKRWYKWDPFLQPEEPKWYEDTDGVWTNPLSYENPGAVLYEDDISYISSQATTITFEPSLQNVDTRIKVNIKRPEKVDVNLPPS
ncbi:hypothetical protein XENTR_v10010159 [Xenopus tropicalis]|nr:hypothetical protein XENTR_v10010159 [Xenopus tropicalis]